MWDAIPKDIHNKFLMNHAITINSENYNCEDFNTMDLGKGINISQELLCFEIPAGVLISFKIKSFDRIDGS